MSVNTLASHCFRGQNFSNSGKSDRFTADGHLGAPFFNRTAKNSSISTDCQSVATPRPALRFPTVVYTSGIPTSPQHCGQRTHSDIADIPRQSRGVFVDHQYGIPSAGMPAKCGVACRKTPCMRPLRRHKSVNKAIFKRRKVSRVNGRRDSPTIPASPVALVAGFSAGNSVTASAE